MIKIPYGSLPFKTDRNGLVKIGAGVSAPNNLNNRIQKVPVLKNFKMPSLVYHMSTTPLSEFTPNRIFYVSFSKAQAFLHLSQYRSKMRNMFKNVTDSKIYVYTLKPKKSHVNIILFDKTSRPKHVSNNILGMTYNNPKQTMKAMGKMFNGTINQNNVTSTNFKEGSGDNMILGQILCSKIKNLNGIRNVINQDEFAVCNPKNFFTIFDKEVLNIRIDPPKTLIKGTGTKAIYKLPPSYLPTYPIGREPNIINVEFQRKKNGTSGYISKNNRFKVNDYLKLLHKYGTSKIQSARAKQSLLKITK